MAPDAAVIGKVKLERMAASGSAPCCAGDNELLLVGENSNIQDGCVLHSDMGSPLTIGRNCTIGHKAILHGCTHWRQLAHRHGGATVLTMPGSGAIA